MTFDGDILNISPGDIAVRDQSDAPGLDDATAVPYAVMVYCAGDVRLLSTNGTFVLTSPYEMARSADWYACLLGCTWEAPRAHLT